MAASGALGIAGAVTASRVYLNYHTIEQTLVGAGAGGFTAIIWFAATEILRRQQWIGEILELKIMKMLRIRDLVIEEDLPASGWEKWQIRNAAKKRRE